jgi:hypothetical protein
LKQHSSTQLDRRERVRKSRPAGSVEEEEPEAAMSFVGVVVDFGEEGEAAVLPVTSCAPQ